MRFDEQGWAMGAIEPLSIERAYALLSPEPEARIDAARWQHQAQTFFQASLSLVTEKRYPAGTLPLADAAIVDIGHRSLPSSTQVTIVTMPLDRAPAVLRAAEQGVVAIGGAGFDALLRRARRLWQVEVPAGASIDAAAPLAVAAILASLLLAPVLPPGGGTIFGVKGARERLAAAGWR
ncbi:MAG: hypothetical protein U0359_41550 [Byssovorax sp.]